MWLANFRDEVASTDQFNGHPNQMAQLACGLFGEIGSLLAEIKKKQREGAAYPMLQESLREEFGDVLWYLTRLCSLAAPSIISQLELKPKEFAPDEASSISNVLKLGALTGVLVESVERGSCIQLERPIKQLWAALLVVANQEGVDLREASEWNVKKVRSRWPEKRVFTPLFDDALPEEERLPRSLAIEFRSSHHKSKGDILLRCNGINIGDRVTDNIERSDFYRFHDVFHFSYVVFVGWSPVTRALFKCKRKSDPDLDENQDGARAQIIEEAISALVFNRAKKLNYFEDIDHVDFNLLKSVQSLVSGFEVERVPLWQWEVAILEGYKMFRFLRSEGQGTIIMNLVDRTLAFEQAARMTDPGS